MSRIVGLGHIALRTPDLEQSLAFYRILGAHVLLLDHLEKETGTVELAMIEIGDCRLELIQPETGLVSTNHPDQNWAHLCLAVEDIDSVVSKLMASGIHTFKTPGPNNMQLFGGIRNINFEGPSGELIELSQSL